jgi:hypothetical protein
MRHQKIRHHHPEKRGGSSTDAGGSGTGGSTSRIARLKQLAKEQLLSEDMAVNVGGMVGSIVGGATAGPLGSLAGDIVGALTVRQAATLSSVGIEAADRMRNRQDFQRASRVKKVQLMAAEIRKIYKERGEKLADDATGDISGWAIGNLSATVLGALPVVGKIPLTGAAVAMLTVPKVVQARRNYSNRRLIAAGA